jgi:dienelactone hydrolase
MTRRQLGYLFSSALAFGQPRRKMELAMGPFPSIDRRAPLRIITELTEDAGTYERLKITFEPEPGRRVPAWLLAPKGKGRGRAALCLHQTTRIGKDEPIGRGPKQNLHYAKELAERGWVCLAPDYPSFGDYTVDFDRDVYARGYQSGTMFAIVNHTRAVDVLAAHARVDAKKMAVIGHSLGGHNSLFVAAFDPRLKAVVTSCGFNAFAKYFGGNLKGWTSQRYMPKIAEVYHNSPREVPFDFTDVFEAIAPRAIFVNAPLRDANFEVSGVRDVAAAIGAKFPKSRLVIEHPDADHDFPPDVRERAYAFMKKHT